MVFVKFFMLQIYNFRVIQFRIFSIEWCSGLQAVKFSWNTFLCRLILNEKNNIKYNDKLRRVYVCWPLFDFVSNCMSGGMQGSGLWNEGSKLTRRLEFKANAQHMRRTCWRAERTRWRGWWRRTRRWWSWRGTRTGSTTCSRSSTTALTLGEEQAST